MVSLDGGMGVEILMCRNFGWKILFSLPGATLYLFIRHDGMQPGSYGHLEKQIKCLERERANNTKVMPSSP
jgi:hypothetical protein